MKAEGVEAIEITGNIGGKQKTVAITRKTGENVAKILAEDAMAKSKASTGTTIEAHTFGPTDGTTSAPDVRSAILQPQIITCPYCEGQDVDVLSNETITSQLCLFETDAPKTETKVRHNDTFICSGCSAVAKLSWRQAKGE